MSGEVMGASAILQAIGTYRSGSDNSRALKNQAATASAQALADEASQRRQANQFLGSQAAAMAQAGGIGGTNDLIASQSEIAAELDALNIRYSGMQRRAGLLAEAKAVKREATFMAGAQLLGAGSRYQSNRKILASG